MIRIVLDTNVFVSSILWGGKPRAIVSAAERRLIEIATSNALLSELLDVLSRPKVQDKVEATGLSPLELIENGPLTFALIFDPESTPAVVFADPDDDAVVACAIAAGADYIISGDRHLLSMGEFQGIKICTAEQFIASVMPSLLE